MYQSFDVLTFVIYFKQLFSAKLHRVSKLSLLVTKLYHHTAILR